MNESITKAAGVSSLGVPLRSSNLLHGAADFLSSSDALLSCSLLTAEWHATLDIYGGDLQCWYIWCEAFVEEANFLPDPNSCMRLLHPASGAKHGQELPPERMEELIVAAGRIPQQRTTNYTAPPAEQTAKSYGAPPLEPVVNLVMRFPDRGQARMLA